ncbi:adenosylmethionine decarboxylase [Portibacter lacus]|uniref:S-adenosylmethionine decarboxylase proenzyme n=1 Tax=Portibacter lacus TaxID=1099794 RepID=A0AA37SMP4_9BACT|nr:adenosylmethionine decarboxylase [Portibacter lacus]GLR16622.1 S-adenosylmethionine decarboxylase proenzyme [Portibacter lacus]
MRFLGKQYMVELKGCNAKLLDDPEFIGTAMREAALKANATIVQQFFHQFSPFGVSGTIVIAESHINIHTWPEHAYAAIDMFTCSDTLIAENAIEYLKEALEAKECTTSMMNRGQID